MPRDKNIFTLNPTSIDMKRSVFNRNSQHKTSFNIGQIIPIYMDEILPGDTVSLDVANVVRMETPIAPIMDNLYCDIYFFFVPNRLVWNHWAQFNGENDTAAWTQTGSYSIPSVNVGNNASKAINIGSLGDYFGLPLNNNQYRSNTGTLANNTRVSELPLRAYYKIINDWWIDENNVGPVVFSIGDAANSVNAIHYGDSPYKASRFHDLFSSCLPAPQKGGSVVLPLGTTADVIGGTSLHSVVRAIDFQYEGETAPSGGYNPTFDHLGMKKWEDGGRALANNVDAADGSLAEQITKTNLVADLSNATAATINQIRMAFQVQKLLEKDARGGRYISLLLKKIAEKIWKVLVRIIRGEGLCQPQRIDGEIIYPRGRDTFVKRYAELCSNV